MNDLCLYDYPASGNCLKVRILLAHLGVAYERAEIDIFAGDTLTPAFAAINPARQVPVIRAENRYLTESNAILWYLAEGSPYLPADAFARGKVVRALLFECEQVSTIAALRFRLLTGLLKHGDSNEQQLRKEAEMTLDHLESKLRLEPFLAGAEYSIADIATYCYVHVAPETGLSLDRRPAIREWIGRVESQPGFTNDLVPLPDSARVGRGSSIYG